MSTSPLSALANIISSNVRSLEEAYAKHGVAYPSLDDPFDPSPLDFDPALAQARSLIVAAAAQIMATARNPRETLPDLSLSLYMTACLGFVVDANIPEILEEGGPQGVHVNDISTESGVDPPYIARVLRFLATRHVFREVNPNVFANNRISSLASKSKTLKEIKADPESALDNARLAAFLLHNAEESLPASTCLSKFLRTPGEGSSPFNMAFKTDAKMWDWFDMRGNEGRAKRFSIVLKGARWPGELIVQGVGCKNLKDNDVVVDVGGNIGTCTLPLYKANPRLKYYVQDLPSIIETAGDFWNQNAPEAINSGRVLLQGQDFFKPQQVKGAAIYFLRIVIHDWSDREAKAILKNLREAANDSSKLVIFDFVSVHVCEDNSTTPATNPPPYPLLANLGIAGQGFDTGIDMQMMNLVDGIHRTEEEYRNLGTSSGWKLESVVKGSLPILTFSAA